MAYNNISAPNNLQVDQVNTLVTKNQNFRMRRVTNAAPAIDNNDYTTLGQVTDTTDKLQANIDAVPGKIKNMLGTTGIPELVVNGDAHVAFLEIIDKSRTDYAS